MRNYLVAVLYKQYIKSASSTLTWLCLALMSSRVKWTMWKWESVHSLLPSFCKGKKVCFVLEMDYTYLHDTLIVDNYIKFMLVMMIEIIILWVLLF